MNKKETKSGREKLFWGITILIPLILLAVIEFSLHLFEYDQGREELFIEYQVDDKFLITNPKFVSRYFPAFQPKIAPNPFRKEKGENTFRVFVFGGSTAIGFPHNFYYSFASQLEQKLLLNTNGLNVEVINLGMTAVNSYVIRDLSKRVMEYEPDAIIIYAGHNEYYGSFGVGSTQFSLVNNLHIKRLVLRLKDVRLYRFLENMLRISPEASANADNRTLMAKVVKESNVEKGSKIYESGIKQYQENIRDVIDLSITNNVPVYIGTVGSNLKDQAPLGENEEALAAFEKGNRLYKAGEFEQAFEEFEKSKELDGIRFRAPEAINQFIVEASYLDGVTLVNTQKLLREVSENGIEDESIFVDHLHPNAKGHNLMAKIFLEKMFEHERVRSFVSLSDFDVPKDVSRFEDTFANTLISRLEAGYPFKKGLSIEEELAQFQNVYQKYLDASYIDSVAAVTARNNKFVPVALTEVVNKAREAEDSIAVASHYYELLKWQTNSIDLIEKGIEYSVNNKSLEVYLVNMLVSILNDGNYDPRYMDVLSAIYIMNEELEKAKYWLDESEKIDPSSANMLYNFVRYHFSLGETQKAGEYYSRFIEVRGQSR
ncbi:MAG: SGNH/GDSL hydrolase family protein [Balneola sp.]